MGRPKSNRVCCLDRCDRKHWAKGYCVRHYKQITRLGRILPEDEERKLNVDLTGKKFSRWTVIKRAGRKRGDSSWECVCECGTIRNVSGNSLKRGRSRSCGCLAPYLAKTQKRTKYISATSRAVFASYRANARKRGFKFEISYKDFYELTQRDCFYCGSEPGNIHPSKHGKEDFIYNGLDRVDNSKGYTLRNVVPCCLTCNAAKEKTSLRDFIKWIDRVHRRISNMVAPGFLSAEIRS